MTEPKPPQNIALLVEVLGLDGALTLIEKRGGTKFYVPSGVNNSSFKLWLDLEAEFGSKLARALIRGFGGGFIDVPLCADWRTDLYASRGLTQAQIALKLGCHEKTVRRRMQRGRRETRQSCWPF